MCVHALTCKEQKEAAAFHGLHYMLMVKHAAFHHRFKKIILNYVWHISIFTVIQTTCENQTMKYEFYIDQLHQTWQDTQRC